MKRLYIISTGFLIMMFANQVISQNSIYQQGKASFYADKFDGRITASGELYKSSEMTAAHRELPFGTFVKVVNIENNQSIIVRINDRGPYIGDRIIDLSKRAAEKLGFIEKGVTEVTLEIVEQGNDVIESATGDKIDNNNTNSEFYKLKATKYLPKGYGIQVASYAEAANLMRIADKIERTQNSDISVQVVSLNETKTYRVILGNFASKNDALNTLPLVKKSYPDCFIISF